MSGHRIPSDMAKAEWQRADPGTGKKFPGSGPSAVSIHALVIGAGAETNTLPDPERPGLQMSITAYSVAGGTRVITASTKIDTTPHTIITFSAVDQHVTLLSVPYAGNTTKARWQIDIREGASLS